MRATKPISVGDEILNDFGPLPSADLLRRYGYVTEEYKQYDVVDISVDLRLECAATLFQVDIKYFQELNGAGQV